MRFLKRDFQQQCKHDFSCFKMLLSPFEFVKIITSSIFFQQKRAQVVLGTQAGRGVEQYCCPSWPSLATCYSYDIQRLEN
jgi:hypothetical protein